MNEEEEGWKAGRLGVVVHICDLRVWEADMGRS